MKPLKLLFLLNFELFFYKIISKCLAFIVINQMKFSLSTYADLLLATSIFQFSQAKFVGAL